MRRRPALVLASQCDATADVLSDATSDVLSDARHGYRVCHWPRVRLRGEPAPGLSQRKPVASEARGQFPEPVRIGSTLGKYS